MPTCFGERIHCDLVGPTKASLNGEMYAIVTRDEATGHPSVRPLRSKTAAETAAAWNDMPGGLNPPVLCCRTDNEGEFDAEFDMQLKQQRIRHERSLPHRPQTNARAERFHRILAEGMRSLMLMSGFWAFCLAALVYLYARSPTADGGASPFERRFDRVYDVSRRQMQKFEPPGRLGVVLGYGRLESYVVLDYEHNARFRLPRFTAAEPLIATCAPKEKHIVPPQSWARRCRKDDPRVIRLAYWNCLYAASWSTPHSCTARSAGLLFFLIALASSTNVVISWYAGESGTPTVAFAPELRQSSARRTLGCQPI